MIPKSKSRPIEVDGKRYRWMVRRCRGASGVRPVIRLTVEDGATGDVFQKDFAEHYRVDDYGNEAGLDNRVTPACVRDFVRSLDKPCRG